MSSGVLHTLRCKASRHNARYGDATVAGLRLFTWDADYAASDFVGANVTSSTGTLADNFGAWHLLEPALTEAQIDQQRSGRNVRYAARLASEHIPAIDAVAEVLASLWPRLRMGVVWSTPCAATDRN